MNWDGLAGLPIDAGAPSGVGLNASGLAAAVTSSPGGPVQPTSGGRHGRSDHHRLLRDTIVTVAALRINAVGDRR
jgi:hypothetical protein